MFSAKQNMTPYSLDIIKEMKEIYPQEELDDSIENEIDETQRFLPKEFIHEEEQGGKLSIRRKLKKSLYIVGILLLLMSYAGLASHFFQTFRSGKCIFGNERAYSDVPIIYEKYAFHRAGFHDSRHQAKTLFEGPPNARNNAAWERLLSVGIISISEAENERLSIPTAQSTHQADEYVVELEVFHQLHCLKWLRQEFWDLHAALANQQAFSNASQHQYHFDHCIDYLRQVIMCHGDVTPITFEWNDEIGSYLARHKTEHQCRNFEAIFEWARGRDNTGMAVDGDHKNVELQKPEKSD